MCAMQGVHGYMYTERERHTHKHTDTHTGYDKDAVYETQAQSHKIQHTHAYKLQHACTQVYTHTHAHTHTHLLAVATKEVHELHGALVFVCASHLGGARKKHTKLVNTESVNTCAASLVYIADAAMVLGFRV